MSESLHLDLDVTSVLKAYGGFYSKDPEAAVHIVDVLRLILNRDAFTITDISEALRPLVAAVNNFAAIQTKTAGDLMAKHEELDSKVTAQGAQMNKAFAEIRKALDDALASQITQEEFDAAVLAATAAGTEAGTAAERTASEAKNDAIIAKLTANDEALKRLDDIVPDNPSPVV